MAKVSSKISKSSRDTAQIAREFVSELFKNKSSREKALVIGLSGDLGVGKTAFTQEVAKILGVKRKVNSPTFLIMKKYPIKKGKHKFLFHLDAYRLKKEKELLHLGWAEIISNPEHIVFIEWPENIAKAMPKNHHLVKISHTKEGHRSFKIKHG